MAASSYNNIVQELYIAYFGRPADANGLTNFEAALAAIDAPTDIGSLSRAYSNNPAVKGLIDSLGTSAESNMLYGTVNSGNLAGVQTFVTQIFEHLLNRTPAADGLAFWSNAIASGQLSLDDAALSIVAGASSNNTDQGKLDAQLLQNKIAVAETFTSDISDATGIAEYQGAAAANLGRDFISSVTVDINPASTTAFYTSAGVIFSSFGDAGNRLDSIVLGPVAATTPVQGTTTIVFSSHTTSPDHVSFAAQGAAIAAIITGLNNVGSDTITFAADENNLHGFTQVTASNVAAASLDAGSLAGWVAAADGAAGSGVAGSAHSVTWFQFQGNTYLIESVAGQSADSGTMAANNTLVELTGTGYTFNHTTAPGGVMHLLG